MYPRFFYKERMNCPGLCKKGEALYIDKFAILLRENNLPWGDRGAFMVCCLGNYHRKKINCQ